MGLMVAMATALQAQDTARDARTPDVKAPKHGVRFVICSPGGNQAQLPSPLYAKMGKDYYPITISQRMPSPRLTPEGGVVKFYASMPSKTSSGKDKEPPVLTVTLPDAYRGSSTKSLCIVQPTKANDTDPQTFFLKESDFKIGGVYIINFTNSTLEMVTYPPGKSDGEEKRELIKPRMKTHSISVSDSNVWSYMGKSSKGDKVNFVLQALPAVKGVGHAKRIRASVLLTNKDLSQINVVVPHPTLKDSYKLLSVQYSNDEEQGRDSQNVR